MSLIYLVRHGQASFGAENYDNLSELGRLQARVLGEYFANHNIRFDAVYAGDLKRQQDTASIVLSQQPDQPVELVTDQRFNEIDTDMQFKKLLPPLKRENKDIQVMVENGLNNSKNFQKVMKAVFNLWVSGKYEDDSNDSAEKIESWLQYSIKVQAALHDVIVKHGRGKTIAVFTSGGTIATLVSYVLGLNEAQTYQLYEPVVNCSLTQILYNANYQCSLSNFNDFSYLQQSSTDSQCLISYR